ncbi:MAG TPA: hypothetical protein DIT07_16745, partial [Sphingobacteriaceae bacterium]|nr:hypothetical protein [Sphingobacteriaceae bacterium]
NGNNNDWSRKLSGVTTAFLPSDYVLGMQKTIHRDPFGIVESRTGFKESTHPDFSYQLTTRIRF